MGHSKRLTKAERDRLLEMRGPLVFFQGSEPMEFSDKTIRALRARRLVRRFAEDIVSTPSGGARIRTLWVLTERGAHAANQVRTARAIKHGGMWCELELR